MHLPKVCAERTIAMNVALTVSAYLLVIAIGGIWGIVAAYFYFAIETALRGNDAGAVAAVFLPIFMSPWAAGAGWAALKLIDG
jgi:hypothetical protein